MSRGVVQARLEQDGRPERVPLDAGQARAAPTNAVMKMTLEEAREQVRQLPFSRKASEVWRNFETLADVQECSRRWRSGIVLAGRCSVRVTCWLSVHALDGRFRSVFLYRPLAPKATPGRDGGKQLNRDKHSHAGWCQHVRVGHSLPSTSSGHDQDSLFKSAGKVGCVDPGTDLHHGDQLAHVLRVRSFRKEIILMVTDGNTVRARRCSPRSLVAAGCGSRCSARAVTVLGDAVTVEIQASPTWRYLSIGLQILRPFGRTV